MFTLLRSSAIICLSGFDNFSGIGWIPFPYSISLRHVNFIYKQNVVYPFAVLVEFYVTSNTDSFSL